MRTLLGMVLFSMVGCDALWASYINTGDFGTDAGMTCAEPAGCDLGVADLAMVDEATPPDLTIPGCSPEKNPCSAFPETPYCDFNTGVCVTTPPAATDPFLSPVEITLDQPYMLMATGDYDNDKVADVAVSGVFTGGFNPNNASAVPVDIYLGGDGGLKYDSKCPLPGGEKPVHLLTVPGTGQQMDLLVATHSGKVYRCSKASKSWVADLLLLSGGNSAAGFKQLALAVNENKTRPDLVMRTNKNLFTESTGSGNIDVYRVNGNGPNFDGLASPINITSSNATWIMPYRFSGLTYDYIGTTWDAVSMHAGVEFHYIRSANNSEANLGSGGTGTANVAGIGFADLANKAYAATALFHMKTKNGILFTYSQAPNSVTVLSGADLASMTKQGQMSPSVVGITLPYAGDANEDGQDEIGIYTTATTGTNLLPRHLQLYTYKEPTINATPIIDISLVSDNFRGMALEYLANDSDRKRLSKRKELIALIENPGAGGKSRLQIRRANLNYLFPQ